MGLFQAIKRKNHKEQFMPSAYSVVFNPYFFNRRAIYTGLKKFAPRLTGEMLDFGCGTKPYKSLFNVNKHLGIDLEVNEGHNLPTEEVDVFYDGSKLPFESNTFDSIYSSEVFEHVFNLPEILDDINRVHKPGGLLLITMPFVWQEHEMPNDFGRYTSAGIASVMKGCNYEIVEHFKRPSYFQAVVQLWAAYVYTSLLPGPNMLKWLLSPLIIFPINLFGLVFNLILPKSEGLYINHVILARNTKPAQ